MDKVTLTVFFDNPFWVGVFERVEGGKLSACKVTFGTEPRDAEVLEFVQRSYSFLRFSPAVDAPAERASSNPKRLQREARRQTASSGVGTKSQRATAAAGVKPRSLSERCSAVIRNWPKKSADSP